MQCRSVSHHVSIMTTARLHMGFLDMNGGFGRHFGSLGLSLEEPATVLAAKRSDDFSAAGPGAARALAYARKFAEKAGIDGGAQFKLEQVIPEHAGLGSGTQMALAVGVALARLYGLSMSLQEIAAVSDRGRRSGIGIGAFSQGGLLLDGGRGASTVVPPIIARLDFPEEWRILLIFDQAGQGVHGSHEIEAFRTLPVFPSDISSELCRRVLMQALPAVVEHDLVMFGEAIHEIQACVGDHFAAAQGGGRYTSQAVSAVLEWMRGRGVGCAGQSSWGPTGFAILGSEAEAKAMQERLATEYAHQAGLSFRVCKARNRGSDVRLDCENDEAATAFATN